MISIFNKDILIVQPTESMFLSYGGSPISLIPGMWAVTIHAFIGNPVVIHAVTARVVGARGRRAGGESQVSAHDTGY